MLQVFSCYRILTMFTSCIRAVLQDAGSVSYLAASLDDKFLYVATCLGGLACISACSNQVLAEWKPEIVPSSDVSVTKMCVDMIDKDVNLVVTVENTGNITAQVMFVFF